MKLKFFKKKHKCKKKDLIYCGEGEFYWCKTCKKEFDFPWKKLPKR